MQKVKELNVQEMKRINGGGAADMKCAANTVGGAMKKGVIGAVGGFLSSCVHWGYNKKPQHGWH